MAVRKLCDIYHHIYVGARPTVVISIFRNLCCVCAMCSFCHPAVAVIRTNCGVHYDAAKHFTTGKHRTVDNGTAVGLSNVRCVTFCSFFLYRKQTAVPPAQGEHRQHFVTTLKITTQLASRAAKVCCNSICERYRDSLFEAQGFLDTALYSRR